MSPYRHRVNKNIIRQIYSINYVRSVWFRKILRDRHAKFDPFWSIIKNYSKRIICYFQKMGIRLFYIQIYELCESYWKERLSRRCISTSAGHFFLPPQSETCHPCRFSFVQVRLSKFCWTGGAPCEREAFKLPTHAFEILAWPRIWMPKYSLKLSRLARYLRGW